MATLATNVSFQCLGLDGKPLAGGKVYTYEAGTTTPKNTYTTHEGDVPNTNPVILDQSGKAKIFLGDGAYRIRIEDKDGALVDDINQISRYVTQSDFAEFQQTVETGINELEQVKDQIDVYVDSSISDQKGYAGGIAPLNENNEVDPIYLPGLPHDAAPQATEDVYGVAKIATKETAQAGANDTDILTAKKLRQGLNASGNAPIAACRAWVNFSASGGVITVKGSLNIASVTRVSAGVYTVNFNIPMPIENYAVFVSNSGNIQNNSRINATSDTSNPTIKTVDSVQVAVSGTQSFGDTSNMSVGVFC